MTADDRFIEGMKEDPNEPMAPCWAIDENKGDFRKLHKLPISIISTYTDFRKLHKLPIEEQYVHGPHSRRRKQ